LVPSLVDVNRCSPEVDRLSLKSTLVRLLGKTLIDIRPMTGLPN
jgi:hypothetical protein